MKLLVTKDKKNIAAIENVRRVIFGKRTSAGSFTAFSVISEAEKKYETRRFNAEDFDAFEVIVEDAHFVTEVLSR